MNKMMRLKSYIACAMLVLNSAYSFASEDLFVSGFENPYSSENRSHFESNEKLIEYLKQVNISSDSLLADEADLSL